MRDDSVLLNVAAIPPRSIATAVHQIGLRARQLGGLFDVDGRKRHAHLTIYMARFPSAAETDVQECLSEIVPSLTSIPAIHQGYFVTYGNYYEISYERTNLFASLQKAIMEVLAPMRYSAGKPRFEGYFAPYSTGQRKSAKDWGYDLAENLFRPHITVTRFAGRPRFQLPQWDTDLSFEVNSLGVFRADDLGSVGERVAEHRLSAAGVIAPLTAY